MEGEFAAAGGFNQVMDDSGAGKAIAETMLGLKLSPVLLTYLVAVLMRGNLQDTLARSLFVAGPLLLAAYLAVPRTVAEGARSAAEPDRIAVQAAVSE